jgi:hypothetical protein
VQSRYPVANCGVVLASIDHSLSGERLINPANPANPGEQDSIPILSIPTFTVGTPPDYLDYLDYFFFFLISNKKIKAKNALTY